MKKGYKVTDVKRAKKFGVAAGSLEELIEKSCNKLGVSWLNPLILLLNKCSTYLNFFKFYAVFWKVSVIVASLKS